MSDETVEQLKEAIAHFKQMYLAKDDAIRVNEPAAEAMANGVEDREKVSRVRPPRQQA